MSLKFTLNNTQYGIGDTVKINYKIREKDKERLQAFDGVIIAIQGKGKSKNMTVRKHATDGIIVERIIPIESPWIADVKKLRSPKRTLVRSKLYFLRQPRSRGI